MLRREKQAWHKFTFEGEEFKGEIEAILTEFDERDLDNDEVKKGALDEWLKENDTIPMRWHHIRHEVIGVWANLRVDGAYFKATGQLFEGVQRAEEAVILIKQDAVKGISMGFRSTEYSYRYNYEEDNWGDFGVDFETIQPFEASLVAEPAVPNAQVQALKGAERDVIVEYLKGEGMSHQDALDIVGVKHVDSVEKLLADKVLSLL